MSKMPGIPDGALTGQGRPGKTLPRPPRARAGQKLLPVSGQGLQPLWPMRLAAGAEGNELLKRVFGNYW